TASPGQAAVCGLLAGSAIDRSQQAARRVEAEVQSNPELALPVGEQRQGDKAHPGVLLSRTTGHVAGGNRPRSSFCSRSAAGRSSSADLVTGRATKQNPRRARLAPVLALGFGR